MLFKLLHTKQLNTALKTAKQNPTIILIYIQTRDLKFASGDDISSVSRQKAT